MSQRTFGLVGVCVAAVLAAIMTLSAAPALARQPADEPEVQGAPPAAPAEAPPNTSRWPMIINSDAGQITVFQPQLEDFQGDQLSARAAVSVAPANPQPNQPSIFGAIWLQSRVSTDRVARTVQILDVNVTRTRFPGVASDTEQTLTSAIRNAMVAQQITLSLDELLAMLQTVQKENAVSADLDTTAPAVIFRDHPSVKVQYDGTPKLIQVQNSPLMRVANTPFFVVLDPGSKTYFLKGGGRWFAAPDPLGPFQDAASVPSNVAALADASDYKDPQTPLTAQQMSAIEIVTATTPTELVWTDGEPEMATIANTGLLYVTNTDSDMFLFIDTQQLFVLLSGRWYTATSRNGPWSYVASDKLPPDFARIPPNSDKGDVLAFVSGTQPAADAVADSQVPQTATIDRTNFEQPAVEYDGDPQFQPVQGTPLTYCVNTATPVVFVRQHYYCCYNACWYLAGGPRGPWALCTSVPTEVYLIPPSCPVYPCRFVYVYGYTPAAVYCGYLPGYVGCYSYGGCVVYGTGYYYRPWWGRVYYPRPFTYGFAAHYNSYVGHWGFSFGLATGSGNLWIGTGAVSSHAWGRRDPWFGYGGYRPVVVHNDVNVNIFRTQYISRVRNVTVNRTVRNDVYVRNVYDRRTDVRPETAKRVPVPGGAAQGKGIGASYQPARNDVYADKSGNVYRKTVDGWEARDQNQWKPTAKAPSAPAAKPEERPQEKPVAQPAAERAQRSESKPAPAPPDEKDLNKDYRARVNGDARLKDYQRSDASGSKSDDRSGGKSDDKSGKK